MVYSYGTNPYSGLARSIEFNHHVRQEEMKMRKKKKKNKSADANPEQESEEKKEEKKRKKKEKRKLKKKVGKFVEDEAVETDTEEADPVPEVGFQEIYGSKSNNKKRKVAW